MGKGTSFKDFFWVTNPENRHIQRIPIHLLICGGPRAPMTRECIPILFSLNSRNPNHSFNLAPSISYSSGGRGGPPPNYSDPRIKVVKAGHASTHLGGPSATWSIPQCP